MWLCTPHHESLPMPHHSAYDYQIPPGYEVENDPREFRENTWSNVSIGVLIAHIQGQSFPLVYPPPADSTEAQVHEAILRRLELWNAANPPDNDESLMPRAPVPPSVSLLLADAEAMPELPAPPEVVYYQVDGPRDVARTCAALDAPPLVIDSEDGANLDAHNRFRVNVPDASPLFYRHATVNIRNTRCCRCEEWSPTATIQTHNGRKYCRSCFDEVMVPCRACGERHDPSGCNSYVCPKCTKFQLHGSKWKPNPKFWGDDGNKCYYGCELELVFSEWRGRISRSDPRTIHSERIIKELVAPFDEAGFDPYLHAEMDGSLPNNGLEFVTMPAALRWYREQEPVWKEFFTRVAKWGGGSGLHRSGEREAAGTHVHISRDALRPTVETIWALDHWAHHHRDALFAFSGRGHHAFTHWCAIPGKSDISRDECTRLHRGYQRSMGRYAFFNWTSRTLECRGFTATTTYDELMQRIEFCALVRAMMNDADLFALTVKAAAEKLALPHLAAKFPTHPAATIPPLVPLPQPRSTPQSPPTNHLVPVAVGADDEEDE